MLSNFKYWKLLIITAAEQSVTYAIVAHKSNVHTFKTTSKNEMLCTIWYYFNNLKNLKRL